MPQLSAAQFQDWVHFNEIEPIGPHGDDVRLGTLAMLIGNQNRPANRRLFDMDDFFPWMAAPANAAGVIELSPDEQVAAFDRTFTR